ncbi:MAG: hypothetical protein VX300_01645 [Acidobacteriota bacterium]|jgi:hypothetical protein|nr:hypothetical protein [Acidobacteriota bacterium]|tara:strand:- start:5456 stop:6466 length:1011 start_codon:yes stop_codon:yes gene_type:complete
MPLRSAIAVFVVMMSLVVPAAALAQDTDEAYDQCEDGVRAADAGRWQEAEFRWLKSIAIDPAISCGYNNLAVMFERDGDYDDADEYYRRALQHAIGTGRTDVLGNLKKFQDARISEVVEGVPESEFSVSRDERERHNRAMSVTISVPDGEGRDLADFERILVGPFIVTTPDAPVPVGPRAVAYFRRRIVQRSFLQAVDVPGGITSTTADPLKDTEMWRQIGEESGADLIFTGRIGLESTSASRLVSENIRAPNGEVTEVTRFRNLVKYDVSLRFVLLRGDDGSMIKEGDLQSSREFAAGDDIPADDMYVETLEELLPQLLDAITPKRVEQKRVLIF